MKIFLSLILIVLISPWCFADVYTAYNLKYFNDDQITVKNAESLVKAFDVGVGGAGNFQSSPMFFDNSLIVTYPGIGIGVNDLSTGRQKCMFTHAVGPTMRGITVQRNSVYFSSMDGNIYSFSTNDCSPNNKFGKNGIIKAGQASLLPPIIDLKKNIVVHAGLGGKVSVFDLSSGNQLHYVDLSGFRVYPRIWSGFSYAPELGMAYVVTSNSGFLENFEIKNEDVDFSGSLVAIDVNVGEVKFSVKEFNKEMWDLDFVGSPIIIKFSESDIRVAAFSKTGTIVYVDGKSGKFIFPAGKFPNGSLDVKQPDRIGDILYVPSEELSHLDPEDSAYVYHKIKRAKFGRFDVQNSEFDRVLFGLHGGPMWPGGSYDPVNNLLVIPVNRVPWILRHEYIYQGKKIDRVKMENYQSYLSHCADCHGRDLVGKRESEDVGDDYVPSLIGAMIKFDLNSVKQCELFLDIHRYTQHPVSCEKLSETIDFLNADYTKVKSDGRLINQGFWQYLLTQDNLPAAKPPWGKIIAINMASGKTEWSIPFGVERKSGVAGDFNMGGVATTAGGILLANGTRDAKARIFNIKNGQLLWEYQLNAPGASPPMTYTYRGCQYIAFNASGGKFWEMERNGKFIEVFKLSGCEVGNAINDAFDKINKGSFNSITNDRMAIMPKESVFSRYVNLVPKLLFYLKNYSLAETWEQFLIHFRLQWDKVMN